MHAELGNARLDLSQLATSFHYIKTERKLRKEQKQGPKEERSNNTTRRQNRKNTNEGERYKKSDRNRGERSRDRREKR